MKWKRRAAGVYDSEDGRFTLTHIEHWELAEEPDWERGIGGGVWTYPSLREAQQDIETDEESA